MVKSKPLIIFAFSKKGGSTSPRYGGFASKLKKTGLFKEYDLLTVSLEDLIFIVREDKSADIIDPVSGISMSSADFLYFKSRAQALGEADALAHFLQSRGIPFMDTRVLSIGDSKISTIFKMWSANVSIPLTVYSRNQQNMLAYIKDNQVFGDDKFVIKDIYGSKGKNNFLVNAESLDRFLKENKETIFLTQRFIKNDGDYRIGVYGGSPAFVIHRKGDGTSHLNNISTGGKASFIDIDKVPLKLKNIARRAAKASELEVAGVDVMVDADNDKAYILEVNRGSQIVTGAFVDENVDAFSKAILMYTKRRHAKSRQQPLTIVGRRARARLPRLGIVDAVAKIDSGAYTSTLHAHAIRLDGDELVFELQPEDGYVTDDGKTKVIRTKDFFVQKVRSSTGHLEDRYSIRTKLSISGRLVTATLTLSDRSQMKYPLLIGRRVIRSRFIVNVELSEHNKAEWLY